MNINRTFNIRITTAGALGGLVMGYDSGAISGALLFLKKALHATTLQKELMVSSVVVGAMVGTLVAARLANSRGRKATLLIAGVMSALFSLATAMSANVQEFTLWRFLVGAAMGLIAVAGPMYISELSPASVRGRSSATFQLAFAIGLTASYWGDYAFAGAGNWRAMFALATIPAVLLLLGVTGMPESPRWLLMRDRVDRGSTVIADMYSNTAVSDRVQANIVEDLKRTQGEKGALRELLRPGLRWALIFGVGLGIFQQFGGIKAVTYYSPTVFHMAGFTKADSIFITAVIGIVTIAATVAGVLLVDRMGRRPLLFMSLSGMAASMIGLGVAFALQGKSELAGVLTFTCVMIYHIFFSLGLGLMGWVFIPEIFPTRMRAKGQSVSRLFDWVAGLVVSFTFLSIVAFMGAAGVFFTFAGIIVLALIFVGWLAPETKGKTLEQIESYWVGGRRWNAEADGLFSDGDRTTQ